MSRLSGPIRTHPYFEIKRLDRSERRAPTKTYVHRHPVHPQSPSTCKCTPKQNVSSRWVSPQNERSTGPAVHPDYAPVRREKMMVTISFFCGLIEVSGGLIPLRQLKAALAWGWARCYTPVT